MFRFGELRGHARQGGSRIIQIGGVVSGAAVVAVVAVLVRAATARAIAFDEAIGQKQLSLGVKQLLHLAGEYQLLLAQRFKNGFRELAVFLAVGGVVVVVGNVKPLKVAHVFLTEFLDQRLRVHASLLGKQHGCRAVGIVAANVVHLVAAQALEAHPDVCLYFLQQRAQVYRAADVGQRTGDEYSAGHGLLAAGFKREARL